MGGALLRSVVDNGVFAPSRVYASDARKEQLEMLGDIGINITDNLSLAKNSDVIVLGVKPKDVAGVAAEIKGGMDGGKVLISIAAGVSTRTIESYFEGSGIPVIRVMPNLNIKVKAGLLPYCLGRYAKNLKGVIEKIFSFSGFVFGLGEEKFDAVTAISGSGPGFIFFIAEIMESICKAKGFTPEEADLISAYIIYGSGKNLIEAGTSPAVLKKMVSSPGGTTLAGLSVFVERGLQAIFEEAIEKAEKRSRELSEAL